MTRRICVVTGTRAEFGLLRPLMHALRTQEGIKLQVIATGMHLSPEYGLTYHEIESAGITIDAKIEMLVSSDTASAVTKSMGLGLIGFADAYARLSPDIILLLGDRFEILCAAVAAAIATIPIAHLYGGESTQGVIDEAIRHSVTKMSHIHFVAAEEYRRRVIQLGENPRCVYVVGALGVDAVRNTTLLTRKELEDAIDFKLGRRNLLVTFHPVTLDGRSSVDQMRELLNALGDLKDTHFIFTMPNADPGGGAIKSLVDSFVESRPNAKSYTSLGQLKYLSVMKLVDGVVGNSSSGLIEAPSMGVGSIDIGDRQLGRIRAASVIHCEPNRSQIVQALERLCSSEFRDGLKNIQNPYGIGGASDRIVEIIANQSFEGLMKKKFFDLPNNVISDSL